MDMVRVEGVYAHGGEVLQRDELWFLGLRDGYDTGLGRVGECKGESEC